MLEEAFLLQVVKRVHPCLAHLLISNCASMFLFIFLNNSFCCMQLPSKDLSPLELVPFQFSVSLHSEQERNL